MHCQNNIAANLGVALERNYDIICFCAAPPLNVGFGEQIELLDTSPPGKTVYAPGESVNVALLWRAAALMSRDYTVFVQLLGPDGKLYGQMDAPPHLPTSMWTPGEIGWESYRIPIDPDAPLGEYRLIAGLYHFETGERLSYDDTDFATLALLQVRE